MPPKKQQQTGRTIDALDLSPAASRQGGGEVTDQLTPSGQVVTTAVIEHVPSSSRRQLPARPSESNEENEELIESIEEDEIKLTSYDSDENNIYDNINMERLQKAKENHEELPSDGRSDNSTPTTNYKSVRNSVDRLPPDKKKQLLDRLQRDVVQEKFPTNTVVAEASKVNESLARVSEQQDMLNHLLQTVQVSRDDIEKSAKLFLRKVTLAEQEADISRKMADMEDLKLRLEKTKGDFEKINSGAVSEEEEIAETMATSLQLTGRASKATAKENSPKKEESKAANEEETENEEENEVFTDASETFTEPENDPPPPTPPPKSDKVKKKIKTKSKNVQFATKTSPETEKKRNMTPPPHPSSDENDASVFSNSNSLFGTSIQGAIYLKLKCARDEAEDVIVHEAKSLVALNDAKNSCREAINFMEEKAPTIKSVSVQEIEECEDMKLAVKNVVKKLNKKIESAEEKKEEKKKAARPTIPDFFCYPSTFLSWRKEFKEATKHMSELQKISNAKKAVKTKDEKEKEELIQMFSNCTSFKQLDKALIAKFGNLNTLIPLFEHKIESLKYRPTNIHQEQKAILTILEFFRLLKAHNEERKFDDSVYRKTIQRLREKRRDDLTTNPVKRKVIETKPKPKELGETDDEDDDPAELKTEVDMEDFIARLEFYQGNNFADINEGALAPQNMSNKKEEDGAKGRDNQRRFNHRGHGADVYLAETRKLTCRLCGQEHFTRKCPTLIGGAKKSVDTKKRTLEQKSLCGICLEPKDKLHRKDCASYRAKSGRMAGKICSKLCKHCDSGLNYWICCFVHPVETPPKGSSAPIIPTTETAATRVELTGDCLEDSEELEINGCPPGCSVGEAEIFTVNDEKGETHLHIGVWDTWSKSTLFDPCLIDLMTNKKKAYYNLSTVNSVDLIEGGKGSVNIETENGNVDVEGLLVPLTNKFVDKVTVRIPKIWREKYNLPADITTCQGKISAIFGLDCIKKNISPVPLDQYEGVRLSRSRLTGRAVLSGYDPTMMSMDHSKRAPTNDSFFVSTHRAELADTHQLDRHLLDLLNPAAFSTLKLSVCDSCNQKPQCVNCKFSLATRNLKERREEKLLSDSCTYLEEKKKWIVDPPLKKEVSSLPSYREETLKDMKRFREKLRKNPDGPAIAKELDTAVNDNLANGNYMFEDDILKTDPDFADLQESFATSHYVHKDSISTAVRQTHNFSFSRGGGISYNSVQLTGSSLNNKLFYLILKNRGFLYNLSIDAKKFYNQVTVSKRIAALQKFYWPKDGILGNSEFVVIVALVLLFGSVHSQCLANLCKLKTAEMFVAPESSEAMQICSDSYTDDFNCHSNESMKKCWELSQIITDKLELGGFSFKSAVTSHNWDPGGVTDTEQSSDHSPLASYTGLLPEPPDPGTARHQSVCMNTDTTPSPPSPLPELTSESPGVTSGAPGVTSAAPSVTQPCASPSLQKATEVPLPGCSSSFGMIWVTEGVDCYKLKISVNLSKKKRGKKDITCEILTKEEFESFINEHGFTKRSALSLSHQIFDILNLFYHVKNQLMFLYREIIVRMPGLAYDSQIDKSMYADWVKAVGLMLELKDISIPRCAIPRSWKPGNYISLVCYCDGSGLSSISKIYCRTAVNEDMLIFDANFVQASVKMGELGNNTAVRSEFNSLTLAVRQLEFLTSAWSHIKFNEIFLLADSKVVLGALFSFHARLKLFYCEKVMEAQEVFKKLNVQCFYIPSSENLADHGGKKQLDVNYCKRIDWWKGNFLHLPTSRWPIEKYQFSESDIDELSSAKMAQITSFSINVNEHFLTQLLEKSFSFDKLVRILCYVKVATRKLIQRFSKSKKKTNVSIADYINIVQEELYELATPTIEQCKGLQRQYEICPDPENKKLLLITRSFAMDQQIVQQKRYLINGDCVIGNKLLLKFHEHMASIETQMSKITDNGFFILKARKLLAKVSKNCVICKKLRKVTLQARMGPSYQELASNFPIGYFSICDIMGPLKLSVNRKINKIFFFTISCLYSRVIRILPLFKIDSDSILTALKSACYLNNGVLCRYLAMDFGKQLTSLQTLDQDEYRKIRLETENLDEILSQNKIKVVLSSPWAPYRQSLIERLHKHIKLTLKRANLFNTVLKFHQIYHLCHYLSFTLNNRPLNLRFANNSLVVLTANKLLRGECQGFANYSNFQLNLDGNRLYQDLNNLENQLRGWFCIWRNSYLESTRKITTFLKPSPQQLSLKSVVMVKDHQNNENGYFTVGQVKSILSPRTFTIEYVKIPAKLNKKNQIIKPAVLDELTRPITSLIYLFNEEEGKTVNLDPYSGSNEDPVENNPENETQLEEISLDEEESSIASNVVNNLKPEDVIPENVEDITDKELVTETEHEKPKEKGSVNTLLKYVADENVEKVADLTTPKTRKNSKHP